MIENVMNEFLFRNEISGRLYAVQFSDGAVKIGFTRNASQRFDQLQSRYRGYISPIVRAYIGSTTEHCRYDEWRSTRGLIPSEKREIFPITFGEAVRRIKRIVPDREPFVVNGRDDVLRQFPFLRIRGKCP